MKGFLLKKGTPIIAAKRNSDGGLDVEPKIIKKDVMYFLEDLVIDPLYPSDNPSERHYAQRGFYGFHLTGRTKGYDLIICHNTNIVGP